MALRLAIIEDNADLLDELLAGWAIAASRCGDA